MNGFDCGRNHIVKADGNEMDASRLAGAVFTDLCRYDDCLKHPSSVVH